MFINKREAFRFLRFCTVGLGNTAVDFTAFFLLTLGGAAYLPAQVISYSAGVVNSFLLNRRWTFKVKRRADIFEAARFIIVNGISLLVSAGLLFILYDLYHLGLWPSKFMATAGGIAVNYAGSCVWVFAEKRTTGAMFYET